jgi:hypothetical protein
MVSRADGMPQAQPFSLNSNTLSTCLENFTDLQTCYTKVTALAAQACTSHSEFTGAKNGMLRIHIVQRVIPFKKGVSLKGDAYLAQQSTDSIISQFNLQS